MTTRDRVNMLSALVPFPIGLDELGRFDYLQLLFPQYADWLCFGGDIPASLQH